MNILGKPCLTIRFNTDRPETVMGNLGNLLTPPADADFLARVVGDIVADDSKLSRLRNVGSIYGSNAGGNFAEAIAPHVFANDRAFRWSQNILGFDKSLRDETADF